MQFPTIGQYAATFANPFGLFRTLGEPVAELDPYGAVRFVAGNNAAAFRVSLDDKPHLIKCYTKPGRPEMAIYDYIAANPDSLLCGARALQSEIYVYDSFGNGNYFDMVIAPWIPGNTLETEISRAVRENDCRRLSALSVSFDALAADLLSRDWAHGDLKPDNIIVDKGGSMTLIDYDAMFVPASAGQRTVEIGTPGYQHPARNEAHFDKSIDDYSIALISASLRALALEPGLYGKYHRSDNLLMYPDEILAGSSAAYNKILNILADAGEYAHYRLALQLRRDTIDISGLAERFNAMRAGRADIAEPLQLFEERGLWGYIGPAGNVVLDAVFEQASGFSEGFAAVRINGMAQLIDANGRKFIGGYEAIKPFSEGMAAVRLGGLWGFIGLDGNVAIEPRFEIAGSIHQSRAAVKTCGKWGYVDPSGRLAIEPVYDHAMGFRDDRAEVYKDGQLFYIDPDGNIIS